MPRAWKRLGLLLSALALAGLVALVLVDPIGRRRASLTQRVDALQARVEARGPTRPVLHGEATAGDAWTSYDLALAPLEAAPDDLRELTGAELLARFPASASHLREGARAGRAQRPVEWGTSGRTLPEIQAVLALGRLSGAGGTRRLREDRPREGVRTWLDGLQLARDLAGTSTLVGTMAGQELLPPQALRDHLAREGLAGLDEPALDLLEDGLATLGGSWPRDLPFLEGEELHAARIWLGADRPWRIEGPTWRHGFLRTLAFLDAIETRLDVLEETRAALEAPNRDLAAILACRGHALEQSSNPYLVDNRLDDYVFRAADATLRIRALRALIGHARGRDTSALLELDGRSIVLEEAERGLRARFTQGDGVEYSLELAVER